MLAPAVLTLSTRQVSAHAMERACVLLLPTNLVMFGGAAAVVISVAVLAFVPAQAIRRISATTSIASIRTDMIWPSFRRSLALAQSLGWSAQACNAGRRTS
jgi:hypothetical protein